MPGRSRLGQYVRLLAASALVVYVLGVKPIFQVSSATLGCAPSEREDGQICHLSEVACATLMPVTDSPVEPTRYVDSFCRPRSASSRPASEVDSAHSRVAVYLVNVGLRLVDVDIATGTYLGLGPSRVGSDAR